ncbi:Uncharacterised protein r2_g3340 [Pycnogonum litorale]
MKNSVGKTETLLLSRKPGQCTLHVSGVPLKQGEKFKYLGVLSRVMVDGTSSWIPESLLLGAVMRQLQRSVLPRRELGAKAKLAVFKSVFVPIRTSGQKSRAMPERMHL